MSLIVAVKDNDRFIIGADKQCSTGSNKDHSATKIWESIDIPHTILGGVGSVRASQIIQYTNIIDLNSMPNEITTEYVTRFVVPEIVAALEQGGINCSISADDKTKVIPNTFIFAWQNRAWVIWNDLSVIEIEDYFAIGSGSDVARGALFATKDKDPFYRIVTCIDAAADATLFVDNGVDLLATKVENSDFPLIKNALNLDSKSLKKKKTNKTKIKKKEMVKVKKDEK